MAQHIDGPLYYERLGRAGPVMAFVHPNPMDQSCWLYQMARFSTWYRCIALDCLLCTSDNLEIRNERTIGRRPPLFQITHSCDADMKALGEIVLR